MIIAVFYYTDGTVVAREFPLTEDAIRFAQSEGDHLDFWELKDDE